MTPPPAHIAATVPPLALAALVLLMPASPRAPDASFQVLYPPTRSVGAAGPTPIVIAAPSRAPLPRVSVDGKPVRTSRLSFDPAWVAPGMLTRTSERVGERSQASIFAAAVALRPGKHTLLIGASAVTLRSGALEQMPAGWTRRFVHPEVVTPDGRLGCARCHDGDGRTLGAVRMPDRCSACHGETDLQVIHKHVVPPLARCALCHDPHGARLNKLLVDTKEKLCSKCHEAGHFRG